MGQTLEVRMFGAFQVLRDGEAVPDATWGRRKTRTLFKVLLSERGRVFTTDQLIERLYPEGDPDKVLKNLRGRVSELRRALEPGLKRGADSRYVRAVEGGYCLSREAPCWIDVEAFSAGLEQANSLARTERWRAALEAYERALALYRGPVLVEDLYEDWSAPLRDRLGDARLDALERAAACHGELGQYRRGLEHLGKLLTEAPFREGAIRLCMRFHHYLGEHRRALEAYHAGVGALKDHLGGEPSPATRNLYLQIKAHELPLPRRRAPHNLPAPLSALVGRGRELEALGARLRDPACRLLTLVGPGGAGKTRLALEAARSNLDAFPDGVFWVGLAGVGSAEGIVYEVAQALDFRFFGRDAPRDQLAAYLSEKRMCLILDNFDHVIEGADALLVWLQAAPALTCLVTSRARLGAAGESLFPLEGLAWTDAEDAEPEAVSLFLERARAADPQCSPSRVDRDAIDRICRLLQGMPLAIELAAAWTGMLPPGEIAAEIERGLDFLSGERRGAPERHRSVRASFEYSWASLGDAERSALSGLGAFRGAFPREAAAAVGVSLADLSSLMSKSFVRHTADGYFETHELLRQFALERLRDDPGRATAVHAAHAAHYGARAARWAEALKGARQLEALREFGLQMDNVHAAWRWSLAERPDLCEPFIEGLYLLFEMRGWFHEGARAFSEAVDALAGDESLARAGAEARIRLGRFHFHLGRLESAQRELEAALAMLEAARAGAALFGLGLVHENAGRYEQAEALLQRSLAAFEAEGDAYGAATARLNLGILGFDRGDYEAAGRHYEACQQLCEGLGDRFVLAKALNNRGNLHYAQEEFEEAIPFYERAAAHFRDLGVAWGEHTVFNNLGGATNALAAYDRAQEHYLQALAVSRRLGYATGTAMTLANLSETEHRMGLRDEARAHLHEGLSIARATDVTWLIMDAVVFLGRQLGQEGKHEPAAELLTAMARLHTMQYMRENARTILADMEGRLPLARWKQIRAKAERHSFADVLARVDELLEAG